MSVEHGPRRAPALRLAGWTLLLATLAMGTVLLSFWFGVREQANAQQGLSALSVEAIRTMASTGVRKRGESIARMLAETLTNPLYYFDLSRIGEVVGSAQKLPDVSYVLVFDDAGLIVHDGSSDIATFGQPMNDPFGREAAAALNLQSFSGDDQVDVVMPMYIGDQRIGGVRVGMSLQSAREFELAASADLGQRLASQREQGFRRLALLFLALAAAAGALVLIVSRGLVGPIRRLAAAAQQVAAGDYSLSLPLHRRDELGELQRAFRTMADSISRHEQEILRLAYTDSLTGLANRLAFRERLDQRLVSARAQGQSLALLFIDLDDFKRVNDSLGHDAGDQVLEQVASRLRQRLAALDETEPLLARLGGDEFVILFSAGDTVRDRARQLAETLLSELQRPFLAGGGQAFLGASIGITLYPNDAGDARALLKAGDLAMYQAKLAGKNCLRFFQSTMDHQAVKDARLEAELRGAWERGEISVNYQPILDVANRRLVGAEALLRWVHPRLGVVEPSAFVAIAERCGVIEELGREVLVAACCEAKLWLQDNPKLFVAVNVSPVQLRKSNFCDQVAEALGSSGLPPSALHLEITETAVLGEEAQAAVLVTRLRELGVQIWLDDFGTGFSGLTQLRQVPIDGVKIDRSFVAELPAAGDDLALTGAIISLAHSLGLGVVAEGVETEAQFDWLRERGCDQAQGFWLGRPLNGEEFSARFLGEQPSISWGRSSA
ncbi:putative bifunctional diguanylate cyclase/phosphodiesterase [Pseudomarimonas arenosa]|uniref:EAL domain-containing protein n=1 Tax=Pseudomarimonas arenosa TaxID=2774145 RepID=A0AAW3ZMU5_9GAMM|nr:EAL domain-containing protein [Pseudomarimonas arenosa]MBD8527401.1 EAL domain-containing protein [Pseudomarimonas arenosa]